MVTSSKSTFEPNRMDTPLTEIMRGSLYLEIARAEELLIVTGVIGSTGSGHDERMAVGATLAAAHRGR